MIRQLHYTSTETGQDGVQGFQVTAATAGIPERHQDLAIQLSAYRVPPDFPYDPSPADVRACPVRFGYLPADGVAVLFRSVYTGADFTGRQGNYFAHALVLDRLDELGQLAPITLWDAPIWADGRTPSPNLPSLGRLSPGPLADPEPIRRFLLRTDHLDGLGVLLSAIPRNLAAGSRRVVMVCVDSGAAACWIAAALTSLPRALAQEISFTTFSATPIEDEFALVATTPDVPVRPSPYAPHVLVDLTGAGGTDESVGEPAFYSQAVTAAWRAGNGEPAAILTLAEQIRPPLAWAELDLFAAACALLSERLSPAGGPPLADAADFALRRLPATMNVRVWEAMARRLTGVAELAEPERWSPLLGAAAGGGHRLPAAIEAGYLHGVLAASAAEARPGPASAGDPPAGFWLPDLTSVHLEAAVSDWLRERVADQAPDGSPAGDDYWRSARAAVLVAAGCSPAEQARIVDLVGPLLVDSHAGAAAVWAALAGLPADSAMLSRLVAAFERRLRAPDGLGSVVEALAGAGAPVLATAAGGGSPLAPVLTLATARGRGGAHRLAALGEVADARRRPVGVRTIMRLVEVLWGDDLPTAVEAHGILDLVEQSGADSLATTTFPETVVELLLTAAQGRQGLTDEDGRLAERLLADEDAAAALPDGARRTLDAVRMGSYFRAMPPPDRQQSMAARHAVRLYGQVDNAVGGTLLDAVGWWLTRVPDPSFHLRTLRELDQDGEQPFRTAYSRRAAELIATAEPVQLAPLVAVWLAFSRKNSFGVRLLSRELPAALAGRRSRDLDGMVSAFRAWAPELKALSSALDPVWDGDWGRWWKQWRAANLRFFLGRVRPAGIRRG